MSTASLSPHACTCEQEDTDEVQEIDGIEDRKSETSEETGSADNRADSDLRCMKTALVEVFKDRFPVGTTHDHSDDARDRESCKDSGSNSLLKEP